MFVYIVRDPTSERFKFGMSTRPDLSRLDAYKTALVAYDAHVFPCSNPRRVESAVKRALQPHILRHGGSGRASEVARRGADDANLLLAIDTILATRRLPRRKTRGLAA